MRILRQLGFFLAALVLLTCTAQLSLARELGDSSGEATVLNNIGLTYSALGEQQKALDFFNQALPLLRAAGDRAGEATTFNNIGTSYSELGENQKALDFFNQ